MKTAKSISVLLPIYYPNGASTSYAITEIYDIHLKNCLVEITDVVQESTHEVRLKTEWITKPMHRYAGEFGKGVILLESVISMIDINFFEKFD